MRSAGWLLCGVLAMCVAAGQVSAGESPIGKKMETFKLQDYLGTAHESAECADRDVLVVAFLGTECPLAKLYGPRLAELAREYASKKVGFIAIDANQQDSLTEMASYARIHKIDFPFLKDPANAVADQFGAVRTPEVFVLDKERVIRYWGRIDDQFGIGFSRPVVKRRDLAVAIDELLAGKEVSSPVVASAGCHIGRANRKSARGEVTYTKDIAPLLQKHCVQCHRAGEIGPFTLTSYADATSWSSTVREVVEQQRMPPWHADAEPGKFLDDRRLSASERKTLFDWIENGMPEGNPADLPPPAQFADGWQIPTPDLVLSMPKAFTVPARGTVEYQYFAVDQTFDEDKWVVAAEARPGNRAVVHHIILLFVPPGGRRSPAESSLTNSIATFAPGMPAWQGGPGVAKRIPAGSRLYFQMHYTPNGAETTDLSRAGLVFANKSEIEKELRVDAVVNMRFKIPPQADNYAVNAEYVFRRDMQLVSLLPHMHLRGKAFRIEKLDPNGVPEVLLNVPRYDFNWQNSYKFAQPVAMKEGSKLRCVAMFDNSEGNPFNPDPTKAVTWGDQTWEEMVVAQFEAVADDQDLRLGRPKVGPEEAGEHEVEFSYRPSTPAEAVYLAGTFNEWKPADLKMDGPNPQGVYTKRLKLKPGDYEYKFVLDGKTWRSDPGNPDQVGPNRNSLLHVGRPISPTSPVIDVTACAP